MNTRLPKPNNQKFVKIGDAAKILGVSMDTLRRWEKKGKIETLRSPGGTRLYAVEGLKDFGSVKETSFFDMPAALETISTTTSANSNQTTQEIFDSLDYQNYKPQISNPFEDFGLPIQTNKIEDNLTYIPETLNLTNYQPATPDRHKIYAKIYAKKANAAKFLLSCLFLSVVFTALIVAGYIFKPTFTKSYFERQTGIQSSPAREFSSLALTPFNDMAKQLVVNFLPEQGLKIGLAKAASDDLSQKLANNQNNDVLAASTISDNQQYLQINSDTSFSNSIAVEGEGVFKGDITAPNIIYGLNAGTGITIGPGQTPTISANIPTLSNLVTQLTGDSVSPTQGGTGIISYSKGDILYASDTNTLSTLNIGTNGQTLTVSSNGVPAWNNSSSSGTVTSVGTGNGLTGGTITNSGTISINLKTGGTTSTTNSNSGLEASSNGLSLLGGCTNGQSLTWNSVSAVWQCTTSGAGFSSFNLAGSTGTPQVITDGDTATIAAGDGVTTVGSATDTVTVGLNLAASGVASTATITSGSGLETSPNGLTMLRGCSTGQLLKWDNVAKEWGCANDSGGTSAIINVEEGGTPVGTNVDTLNFGASDFNITESPSGTDNVAIDYSSSHITRDNQTQTITGAWTFAPTTNIPSLTVRQSSTGTPTQNVFQVTDSTGTNTAFAINSALQPILNVGSDATGDIYYRNSSGVLTRLPIGGPTELLGVSGSIPAWVSTSSVAGCSPGTCIINNPSSTQTIAPTGASTVGLSVAQTSTGSPTADIFNITNSAGSTKYFQVNSSGNVLLPQLTANRPVITTTGGQLTTEAQLAPSRGGTGVDGSAAGNGTVLIGNSTGYSLANLTPGTAIGITNGSGSITINNTGVTSAVAGTGIGVSGATGAVTISNTGVLSITGTANQVLASASTGAVTLSLPTSIITPGSLTTTTDLTVNGNTTIGDATTDRATFNSQILGGSPLAFQGATDNGSALTLSVTDPTASRTQTLQDNSGVIPLGTAGNTLFFTTSGATSLTLPTSGTVCTTTTCLTSGTGVASVTGTANQITASPTTGAVILTLPSAITAPGSLVTTTDLSVNGNATIGDASTDRATFNAQLLGASPLVLQGATDNGNNLTLALADPTGSRTQTFQDNSGVIPLGTAGNTLVFTTTGATNVTVPTSGTLCTTTTCLTSGTGVSSVTGTANQISASPTTGAVILTLPSAITTPGSLTTTSTLTSGTDFSVNGNTTIGDAGTDRATFNAQLLGGSPLVFQGATDNANNLTLSLTDPTTARTQTLQDNSGIIPLGTASNTLFFTTTGATNLTLPTSGTVCTTSTCLTSGTGVSSVTGTANQITASPTTGAVILTLPSAITTPGSLTTTTDLTVDGTSTLNSTVTLAGTTPTLAINNTRTLDITDGTNNLLTLADNGTTGTLTVDTLAASNIGAFTATGNITGSGTPTLSGFGTINGATLSGGTLSGGSLSGGTYSNTGTTVTGAYALTLGTTNAYTVQSTTSGADSIAIKPQTTGTANGFTATISTADLTVGNQTVNIPDQAGAATDTFCLRTLANCFGSGSGITGSGSTTNNTIAMFAGSGASVTDSLISQSSNTISIKPSTSTDDILAFLPHIGGSNRFTAILSSEDLTVGNQTFNLPNLAGSTTDTICTVNLGNCFGGGAGGVTTATGTANQVLVNGDTSSHTGAITLTLPSAITTPGSLTTTTDLSVNGNTTIGNASTDRLTVTGQVLGGSPLVFQGATDDSSATTLALTDPTANRTQTLQDNSGIIPLGTAGNTLFFTTSGATSLTLPTSGTVCTTTTCLTSGTGVSSVTGTANQITASPTTGSVTLTLPSAITAPGSLTTTTSLTATTDLTVNGNTTIGNASTDRATITAQVLGGSPLVLQGATDDSSNLTLALTDPTGSRTQTFQDNSGIIPVGTAGNTLFFTTTGATNVTLPTSGTLCTTSTCLTSGTGVTSVTGTTNQITASPTTGAVILTLPSAITTPGSLTTTTDLTVDGNTTIGDASTDRLTVTGQVLGASPLVFQGATDNANALTLSVTDPTAARTQTLQDNSGVIPLGTAGNTLFFTTSGATSLTLPTSGTVCTTTTCLTSGTGVASVTGTANQISASPTTGAVILTLPSAITAPGSLTTTTDLSVNGNTTIGDAGTDRATFNAQVLGASPLVLQGATDNANNLTLALTDPTGSRTQTFQDNSGIIPVGTAGNTLFFTTTGATNLTLPTSGTVCTTTTCLTSGTGVSSVTGTANQITASPTTGAVTLTLPSAITAPGSLTVTTDLAVNGNTTIGNASSDRMTFNAQVLGGSPLAFQGATDDSFTTTLALTDPTANRTQTLQDNSGIIPLGTAGNTLFFTTTGATNVTVPTSGTLCTTTTCLTGSTGVSSVTGTANQITASPTTGAVVVSLPSAVTAPGSLTTTTSLTAGSGLTLTTGALSLTATSGSSAITGYGTSSTTSTTTTGNINTLADSSLAVANGNTGNLLNLTYTNNSTNTTGTSITSGLNIAGTNSANGASGTMETYGLRVQDIVGTPSGGTQNNYGIRIGNQGQSGAETSTGLYVDAQSGSATANYAAIFAGGNVGIGDTTPASLFTVGNADLFQVNSSGAIAAAAGITSSGAITFTGLTTGTSASGICIDASNHLITCSGGGSGTVSPGTVGQVAFYTGTSTVGSETSGFGWDTTNKLFTLTGSSSATTGITESIASAATGLTTGGLFSAGSSATTYVHASAQTGSLASLAFSDASTSTSGTETTNGLNISPTVNTSGAGTKNINQINLTAPAITGCASGTCTLDGIRSNTITSGAASNITSNGVDVQATGVSAGTVNGVNVSNITAGNGTETGINVGNNWDTGLAIGSNNTSAQNGTGISIGNISSTGTNNYGINIGTISGATNNYAINTAQGQVNLADNSNTNPSLQETNNTISTLGAGINTTGMVNFQSTSLTTGKLLNLQSAANTLTTGTLFNASTTSTALAGTPVTGQGLLGNYEWNPGSSSTVTGDLFRIAVNANASVAGNIFDIVANSSSLFSISPQQVTTSVPFSETAPGDLSAAYDLNFTNPTASYIKSAAPLYLQSGETFNSSDLTLQTFNSGQIIFNSPINGSVVTDSETDTTGQTFTEASRGVGYFLESTQSTVNAAITTVFNITGVPNTEGSIIFIRSAAVKAANITTARTHTVQVQINGTQVSQVQSNNGSAVLTAANTVENEILMRMNGAWRVLGTFTSNSATSATTNDLNDLAEWTPFTGDLPEAGDVVVMSSQGVHIQKSNTPYDGKVLGIVSSAPGQVLGQQSDQSIQLALTGRVPVKVSTENGPIQAGDYLTTSSTPGVAMKATHPGPTVAKAMEDYSGQGIGSIIGFVNVSFADPQNALSHLSLDSDGSLVVPSLKVGQLTIDPNMFTGLQQQNGQISTSLADVGVKVQSLQTTVQTLADTLNGVQTNQASQSAKIADVAQKTDILGAQIATQSAQLADINNHVASQSSTLADIYAKQASDSASLAALKDALNNISGAPSSSSLTPVDGLIATGSATLANINVTSDATVSGILRTYQSTVSDTFKALGQSFLGQTTIAGDLIQDGTLTITDGSKINALPTLYIQNSSLAENVDFFNGLVTIDKSGKVVAQEVQTNKLIITGTKPAGATEDPTIGSGTIKAGQTTVAVFSNQVDSKSKIFVTPRNQTGGQSLIASQVVTGSGFVVSLDHATSADVSFDWWVVGTQ